MNTCKQYPNTDEIDVSKLFTVKLLYDEQDRYTSRNGPIKRNWRANNYAKPYVKSTIQQKGKIALCSSQSLLVNLFRLIVMKFTVFTSYVLTKFNLKLIVVNNTTC